MIIRSRYKLIQVLAILFSSFVFLMGAYSMHRPQLNGHPRQPVWMVIGMLLIAIYSPFLFLRRCPWVRLDEAAIRVWEPFRSRSHEWETVKDVYLSRKEVFSVFFIFGQSLEATTLVFENGDKLVLWEEIYVNQREMRAFIARKLPDKTRDPKPRLHLNSLSAIPERRYVGNPYITLNTCLVAGAIIFLLFDVRQDRISLSLLFPFGFALAIYVFLGSQMHYFMIANGRLIIKNHYFPWRNKEVLFENLLEADVETPYRRSTGLRLMSDELGSTLYEAGSLRGKDWDDLISDLQGIGIPVRDDR